MLRGVGRWPVDTAEEAAVRRRRGGSRGEGRKTMEGGREGSNTLRRAKCPDSHRSRRVGALQELQSSAIPIQGPGTSEESYSSFPSLFSQEGLMCLDSQPGLPKPPERPHDLKGIRSLAFLHPIHHEPSPQWMDHFYACSLPVCCIRWLDACLCTAVISLCLVQLPPAQTYITWDTGGHFFPNVLPQQELIVMARDQSSHLAVPFSKASDQQGQSLPLHKQAACAKSVVDASFPFSTLNGPNSS
ncbi:unnamed protein product [Pleuronectes platessa]|uniref:Uncharacterized protein n=1 Tax=Pleuronectes platessa TaxID=8262 RepID=A0A9N7TQQ0_PLEPL|nr:unnamed protein product [Pleuronectes platessa]